REVEQANAQARLNAEFAALKADPRLWLRGGPGKEQPGRPVWTGFVNPRHTQAAAAADGDVITAAEVMSLLAIVCDVLNAFPGATERLVTRLRSDLPW